MIYISAIHIILMNSFLFEKIIDILLNWYKTNKRSFPWRKKATTLYEILIAEILLRKTTAEMVAMFFPKFIKKYPNIHSIKKISKDVLKEDLRPLGLYETRAEILKKLANELETKYEGQIPSQYDELIELYGIGKYIANAVLCFGYNKNVILVDTNINRIFSRLKNKEYLIKISDNHPLWQELDNLVINKNCKDIFMALLDFGALVCKKKNFNCLICPILELCNYNRKSF